MRAVLGPVVFFLIVLWGCAPLPPVKKLEPTPQMQQVFQQAERLYFAKKFPEAGLRYRAYLQQFPTNALTTKAYFRLGEIALNGGNPEKAVGFYEKSLVRGVPADWGPTALYKKGVAHFRLGQFKKVFETLDRLPAQVTDGALWVRAGSLRVSAARKTVKADQEEMRGFLELLDGYELLTPTEKEIGDLNWIVGEKRALEAVTAWAEDPERDLGPLQGLMKKWEGRRSAGFLLWKGAYRSYQKGDYDGAVAPLQSLLRIYPKHESAGRARTLLAELDKRESVSRISVGVVLPLSGPYAVYGESVLHGLECAAGIYQPCRGDLGLNLMVRDTRGDPAFSSKLVRELSEDPNVKVIVGPLPQVEVDEAVRAAESGGIPMVTLSQRKGVAAQGEFIFRNFLTVADQVATLVSYACEEKGWKSLAVLYPQGAAGEEYSSAFESEVDRCGAKVVAKASYPAGTVDFTEPLRALKSSVARIRAEEKLPFEAIFVPDVYRKVPGILEAIRFLEMDGVPLLGGAGWDHPALVQAGEGKVPEGAVFVDGFFPGGGEFVTRDFVATFQAAFGMEPTLLEAYAYDTLRLVGRVLGGHPTASRGEIRQALARLRGFDGVTGTISFDDEGDARRRLILLTVDHGVIRELR